jgi:hypothetical protein
MLLGIARTPNNVLVLSMTTRRLATSTLVVFAIVSAGCRDREITTYRAPKDAPPAAQPAAASGNMPADHPPIGDGTPAPGADMGGPAVPTASGAGLAWSAPAAWTPKALGPMRKGSFSIKTDSGELDLSITAFPGATGGLEANLNRWRGQVGLDPLSPQEVITAAEKFEANGLQFTVVDYAGNGKRLVGAVVQYGGDSWFFKLMGPDAPVAGQKAGFVEFLHTVKEAR